ncbi:MFS transporter [Desulfovirgula thermocuniculi]|uniref:MFS transporter n=1 Tax=Desulfovirgula thermocuniculi TaxID=348842 RepID=UPI001FDF9919|nr:MFS transporter [Desulfovirgula thermocuniculi]
MAVKAEKPEARRPQMGLLFLLSWGHMVTDMAQGAIPALLPVLKQAFALSYTQTSLLVLVSNVASSVIQPLFGYFADRRPARWLLPAGCLVAGLGLATCGRLPWFGVLLAAVALSSLGVAAYHPEGSRTANLASGVRKGSGMAVFSVGGNLGFGLGSLFMAWLLTLGGPQNTVYFALPGMFTAAVMLLGWQRLASLKEEARPREAAAGEGQRRGALAAFVMLLVYIIFRSWLHAGMYTYIPLYYTDYLRGDVHLAGYFVSVFLLAGAFGTLLGGPLTDLLGAPAVMAGSMGLLVPLIYLFPRIGGGPVLLALSAFIGAALISTFSTTIVLGQQLLPRQKGLASGFTIGFGVGAGGVGVLLLGVLADHFGVPAVFTAMVGLACGGLLLALVLVRRFRDLVRA